MCKYTHYSAIMCNMIAKKEELEIKGLLLFYSFAMSSRSCPMSAMVISLSLLTSARS